MERGAPWGIGLRSRCRHRRGDEGPPPRGREPLEVATRCVRAFLGRLGSFGPAGQEPEHVGAFKLDPIFFPPAYVKLTGMLKGYNGGIFQWYFSVVQFFNGIFLRIGSVDLLLLVRTVWGFMLQY